MEKSLQYNYSEQKWRPCPTAADGDCFFHSVFGTSDADDQPYRDKYAKFRRLYWATFLTYYNSGGDVTGVLLELLKRCFNANDRYLHKRIENPDNYTEYIQDVAVSDYWVMVEEIPLLAALENIRIVLFIDGQRKPVVFEPDPELLGTFPFRCVKSIREAVICLVDNHFLRLNPYVESISSKTNFLTSEVCYVQNKEKLKETTYFTSKKTFEKLGSAGLAGGLYQVNLLTMVLLNGLRKVVDWRMSTENKKAGKLDDLIFEYLPSESAILLQAKHKENEAKHKITYNDLISVDKKSDFSLIKYFVSYQEVRSQFNVQNVVLCTNVGFDVKTTKDILKAESQSPESVLYFEGSDNVCYSFKSHSFPDFKQHILEYCDTHKKGKDVTMTTTDIDNFFSHFRLIPNCLGENISDNVIEETVSRITLSESFNSKTIFKDIHKKMVNWYMEKKGRYLTQVEARAFFCDIRSSRYCEQLNMCDVSFEKKNLPSVIQRLYQNEIFHKNGQTQNDKLKVETRIEHVIPDDKEYILNVVKIYKALPMQHKSKVLFVNPEATIEVQKQMIDAFVVQHYTILVVVCHEPMEKEVAIEMCARLIEILNYYKYKNVILIAEEKNSLAAQMKAVYGNYYKALIDHIKFTDLRDDTQEKFKQKKNINFQGSTMSLGELFRSSASDILDEVVNTEIIEKLSRDDKINVGLELQNLDNYYIHRSFNRNGENINEENMYRLVEMNNEKVIFISDKAGMGKSTALTSLALSIKENHPYLWVVRFDLNSYTNIMKTMLTQGEKTITVEQMLESQETSKLRSDFEKKLFRTRQRIVLMLDAVDEISPTYTNLVKALLKDSLSQVSIISIFVTSRPHLCQDFEKDFNVISFTLEPFSEGDQIAFLKKYWSEHLNFQDSLKKSRCESYAKTLIRKMSIWIDEQYRNNIAGIPLQTRMIAEIFQEKNQSSGADSAGWEGCKEFMLSNNDEPIMPYRVNLLQLYEMFINKKRDIFIREKCNPSGGAAADEALEGIFDKCQDSHRAFALKQIFPQRKCDLFACHKNIKWPIPYLFAQNLLRIGIIQLQGDKMDFIHRTFAEFFVTDSLVIELEHADEKQELKKFFMNRVMSSPEFYVIRAFLDSFVQQKPFPLENIFFHNLTDLYIIRKYIKIFAEEGCATILNNLIKYIDLHEGRHILYESLYASDRYYSPLEKAATNGHLNIVKVLWEIDVENYTSTSKSIGQTAANVGDKLPMEKYFASIEALCGAASRGHLEVIKFLLRNCFDADLIMKKKMCMALHSAAEGGHLEVVKLLVDELTPDVNIKNEKGRTALYCAAVGGNLDIVKLLMNRFNPDVNAKDDDGKTPLYAAALNGNLEVVKFLADEYNADVNIKDKTGRTALQWSACHCKLKVVQFLVDKCNADVYIKDYDGSTVYHLAAAAVEHNLELVKYLVNVCDFDFNEKNTKGRTVLYEAAGAHNLEFVKFLVEELNVDVNIKDNEGRIALHWAAFKGALEVVKYMVNELKVDVNIMDNKGRTALHWADVGGKLEVMKFLGDKAGTDVHAVDDQGYEAAPYI